MTDLDALDRLQQFSLLDPMTQSDPFAMYDAMHEAPGIYRMPETGFYIVSRYADLRAVLMDAKTFSNKVDRASLQGPENAEKLRVYMEERGWPHISTLQRTDAPDHGRYRKLVDRVFTVGRVREMTPHIEETAHRLIDGFAARGECDFISEYAMLLPGTILAEEMGLPSDQVATFKKWADSMLAPASYVMDEEQLLRNADIELEAQHHLARLFEERRENPTGDWISALATAHNENEEPLSMAELQSVMSQLIGGGFESTMTAIGHALMQLLNHPDQMAQLRADRSRIKNFVEEVIRYESPTQGLRRRATRDVELSGTLIPEGSVVIVRYGAANRDAAKFACPHMFDMARSNAGTHLAFGAGAHFCVGAVLARQEIAIGVLAILDRLEDIELVRPLTEPIHRANFLTLPLRELPIRFRAR
ncbi:cytochrome P450 [Novosphingobium gossypii]|uniref:cytochrome P450 n=1 Tax=Novosphingobium gossypii TaxID=1604774 RepID=UPI003D255320